MRAEELLRVEDVILEPSLAEILSRPSVRVTCDACGEEIISDRQNVAGAATLCPPCAHGSHYKPPIQVELALSGFAGMLLKKQPTGLAMEHPA